jgi:hypothetical protein
VDGKKVIEHRVTLGTKERQLLGDWVNSNSFNKIAEPVVAGMSDVSFMLTVGAIIAIWFPNIVLPDFADATTDKVVKAIDKGLKEAAKTVVEHPAGPVLYPAAPIYGIRFGQWATDLLKEFLKTNLPAEGEASG